jgi:predicted HTH domain antitoxin
MRRNGDVMEITLQVPDQYLVDHDPTELAQHIKLYAALVMFQSGELSAGAAAELAEVDRFTFAAECQKHGIPLVNYPPEDLRAELEDLRTHA